ncbi:MAG: hypothetical protein RIQ53_877 [Pseudomonadota bacterium]|jgi:hypothetical protein
MMFLSSAPPRRAARPARPARPARWLTLGLPLLLAACVVTPTPVARAPAVRPAPVAVPVAVPVRPAPPPAAAATRALYFYPRQGQDAARQDRDRYECYRWAVQATGEEPGMTPTTLPTATVRPPAEGGRGREADGAPVVAGAVVGAMAGAVVSGPRSGPAPVILGALLGATLGAAQRDAQQQADVRSRERAAERAEQAALIAREQALDRARAGGASEDFRRAMTACMEGRHYTVR